MEAGRDRAAPPPDDVLGRLGLRGTTRAGGRAARRRAAEERTAGPPSPPPRRRDPVLPPRPDDTVEHAPVTGPADAAPSAGTGPAITANGPRAVAESDRARRIDESLTRLTAAHAGLTLAVRDAAGTGASPDPEEPGPVPGTRRRPRAARLLVLAMALLVVLGTAFAWGAQRWLGSAVREVSALDPGSGAIIDPAAQRGSENVLVVAGQTDPGAAAPNTVLVAHLPADGTPLTVLSIPAGLDVSRPPCERWDAVSGTYTAETVPAQAHTQLASALALGGPRCATRVVQQLTGLAVTQYIGIDLDRLGSAVDALGGVQVCAPRPVVDAALGPVAPTAGTVELDGRHARDLTRAGAVSGDPPGDRARIQRQQQVLAAVLGRALSTRGLLDVPQLARLRPALGAALVTDGATLDQMLALAGSLSTLDRSGVVTATVPVTTDPTSGATVLRGSDAATLFNALRTGAPLPRSAAGVQPPAPQPSQITVDVLNASAEQGLAAKIGDTLRGLGFGVGQVGNAAQPTTQTLIRFSPDEAAAADLLAATVPAATTVPDPATSGVLQLVLGHGFDQVLRAPRTDATPLAAAVPAASCG